MGSPPLIAISQLTHTYPGTRKSPQRVALKEISLEIATGEMVALLGPNGSGKSTLLRILTTMLKPTAGKVWIDQIDLDNQTRAVRRLLGVVFQEPALDGRMTVAENLRAAGLLHGIPRREIGARTQAMLDKLGLDERRDERVERLSGGLARRVELAKVLLPEPRILILDEPTAGLDPKARQEFWSLVERQREGRELTVVVTTHLMDEAARCDRVAVLHQGRLLAFDEPERLQQELGQEVLTLHTDDPDGLRRDVEGELGLVGRVVGRSLCIPLPEIISLDDLHNRYGPRIQALTLAHPSLDDVFVDLTGEHLVGEEGEEAS